MTTKPIDAPVIDLRGVTKTYPMGGEMVRALRSVSLTIETGEYVAVIAPGGSHWFGRSGDVRSGSPGVFIIGLDKKEIR